MSLKAWRMTEEDKIKVGKYILDTIAADGVFPKTACEGKQKLEELGVVFEGDVTGVQFHENDANGLMHIAIPPREAVKDRYSNADYYVIPQTYIDIANTDTTSCGSNLTKKQIYEFRIGDYTISHCG